MKEWDNKFIAQQLFQAGEEGELIFDICNIIISGKIK